MPPLTEPDARVSEELSEVLEAILDDLGEDEEATLGTALRRLKAALGAPERELDRRAGSEESVYAELQALVEEFGEDAPLEDFVTVKASAELSELIEALLDEADEETGLTLGEVRAALEQGLGPRLEAHGVLESDAEQAIAAELDALIERYGADTEVEEVLRFE